MPWLRASGRFFVSVVAAVALLGTSLPPVAASTQAENQPLSTPSAIHPIGSYPTPSADSHTLAGHETYQDGDLLISGINDAQWRLPDGTLNLDLGSASPGGGVGFGADGSLYVTEFQYWDRVAKYDNAGRHLATYQLNSCQDPASVQTDSAGNILFGSGGNLNCTYSYITKWGPADNKIADYLPAHDTGWEHGPGWISLEGDDCTVRYTTGLTTVRRYNICTETQLSNFSNGLSLGFGNLILPDNGMIVANYGNIVRLNSSGQVVQTYSAPGEDQWYSVALDIDTGAFWAATFDHGIVYKFDVSTGALLTSFDTGVSGVLGIGVYRSDRYVPPSMPDGQTFGCTNGASPHGECPSEQRAEPVNTATGSYVSRTTDLSFPTTGLGFAFTRTYNSADPSVGVLGKGWTHGYAVRLAPNPDGSITFVDEGGGQYVFAPDGSGGFTQPVGSGDALASVGDGYVLTRRDQVSYTFDGGGELTTLADRSGNALTLHYTGGLLDSVYDAAGRQVTFSYANGRLTGLAGPLATTVTYGYDGSGALKTVTDVRGETWTYGYDAQGRLATITDPNGHSIVSNTYGPTGRVIEQVDARGYHTTYGWDATTQTSTMTDARGGVWTDVYHDNVLLSESDPLGDQTRYVYDSALNRILVTGPRGYPVAMTYDANHNLLTRTPAGSTGYASETWTYNARNDVTSYTDRLGRTTTYAYTTTGNLRSTTGPGPVSPLTQYAYDPRTGLVTGVTDPRGKTTTYGYDAQGDRISIATPLGNETSMTFDALGRMLTRVDARGHASGADPAQYTTTFTWDAAGNLLSSADPLGELTTQAFDPAGNLLAVTDANNHTTSFGYDEGDHLTSVTDARGGITRYAYDETGNLVGRTDANDHVTAYGYDLAGHQTSVTDPLGNVQSTTYDPAGNPASTTDANGNTTTLTYDELDRLTGVTYADPTTPTVSYAYDANDNRVSMTDGAGTEAYGYDTLGRLVSVSRGSDVFAYAYDPAGDITSRTYPGQSSQAFAYDDDGQLTNANGTTSTFDAAGNVLTVTTPDGYTAHYAYDRAGRLVEEANTTTGSTLSRFSYELDSVGNPITMTTREGTVTYQYDELNRLTETCWSSSSCPQGQPASPVACLACVGTLTSRPTATVVPPVGETYRDYTYDPVGNRLSETSDSGVTTYAYDEADRLVTATAPGNVVTTYAFDDNGNEIVAGAATYAYDLANRLVTASVGTTTETYTYAGNGSRLSAATGSQANKTTKFLWDQTYALPQLALERNGRDSLLRSYAYGNGRISQTAGNSTYYYHPDGLGSVADVTSSTGKSLSWTEYYPYGQARQAGADRKAPAVNPFGFTGEQVDATTGLYYLRARQYDPTIGRFVTADPATPTADNPAMTSYGYANDRPTRLTDRSGRNPLCEALLLGVEAGPVDWVAVATCFGATLLLAEAVGQVAAHVEWPLKPTGTLQEPLFTNVGPPPPPQPGRPSFRCTTTGQKVVCTTLAGLTYVYYKSQIESGVPTPAPAPPPALPEPSAGSTPK